MSAPPTADPPRLRRVPGAAEVSASAVGIIIGAGIYVLLGAAAAEAGDAVWVSFVVAAGLCAGSSPTSSSDVAAPRSDLTDTR